MRVQNGSCSHARYVGYYVINIGDDRYSIKLAIKIVSHKRNKFQYHVEVATVKLKISYTLQNVNCVAKTMHA